MRATTAAGIAAIAIVSVCPFVRAQAAIRLTVCDIDTMYPNQCNPGGCWPSFIPDASAPCQRVLGFTGAGVFWGFRGVVFPSNPSKIVVNHAGPDDQMLDFYQDGVEGGTLFWEDQLLPTAPSGWAVFREDTITIDATFLSGVDLSGTHDFYVAVASGASGNFSEFTIICDGSAAKNPSGSRQSPAAASRGYELSVGAGNPMPSAVQARVSAVFDVRGRRLTSGATPTRQSARQAGSLQSGVVVVQRRD